MSEEVKNNIIILALDNLIQSYSIALENNETTLDETDKEYLHYVVDSAALILGEYANLVNNQKPQWNKI